ncbi:hypothetical protein B0H11DRAFT_2265350 [Mycena galericulata]|nr:hypothetical protein B0H11DRAFT_2265350 [Mycena galericulata]
MPTVASTLRPSTSSVRARGKSSATHSTVNKENETAPAPRPIRGKGSAVAAATSKKPAPQENAEYSDNDRDDDEDYNPSPTDTHDEQDERGRNDEDEEEEPRGRVRRVSEKQRWTIEEQEKAAARKVLNAKKAEQAARKKAGEVEEDTREPIDDNHFTERTVTSRPKTTKNLAQRDSRVPPAPKFSGADLRELEETRHRDRDGHRRTGDDLSAARYHAKDRRHSSRGRSSSREHPSARAPMRNINGGNVPGRGEDSQRHQKAPQHTEVRTPRPRSPSPEAGDKRPRSPSGDSDDLRSTQSQRTSTSGSRPRARDLDDRTKEYVTCAVDLYRCHISVDDGFPESQTETYFVKLAWEATCAEMGEELPLTPAIAKLISSRGPQLRGELKTKIKSFFAITYGFKTGQNKKTIAYNRQLAEDLKDNSTFAFRDTKAKKGLYKHSIFQMAANAMWFANRRDEGPTHPEIFNPFPIRAFVLILTAIENNIDEYLTGIRTDVPFTANEYRSVYDAHLKSVREFQAYTAEYKILDKILARIHDLGRFHSGAQPVSATPTSHLSREVLDRALKEYEDGSTTEESSDDEDEAGEKDEDHDGEEKPGEDEAEVDTE